MPGTKHPNKDTAKADVVPQSSSHCDEFLEAMIAACAIVAHADGRVLPAERRKLHSAIRTHSDLARYSREEVYEGFLVHERNFILYPEAAYDRAVASIKPMAARRADALFLIDACRAMILADGIAEPEEFQAIRKIKKALGLESPFDRR